jgi:hypothetical protein
MDTWSNLVSYTGRMPDAQPAGHGVSWREHQVPPRHAAVWVKIAGTWRMGLITYWAMPAAGGGWECVIAADEAPGGPPWQGRYVYDPLTIRPRHGDVPPG